MLVDPAWRDNGRLEAFPAKLAERFPDAIVVTAGIGVTSILEQAALKAGLRVAAFRQDTPPPAGIAYRPPHVAPEDEPPYTPSAHREPRVVKLHERLPTKDGDGHSTYGVLSPRVVETLEGEAVARARAVELAAANADEVIVFSPGQEWAAEHGGHRLS